jgi:predicted nucleotidyltransferase
MQFVMPVRSLSSSVIKWPDLDDVREAIDLWAREEVTNHPELLRLGYFGSAARGDWGVGSDLDLIAVVSESGQPFERRGLSWSLTSLPVPSDLLVYTENEWNSLQKGRGRFARTLSRDTVWIYTKGSTDSADLSA